MRILSLGPALVVIACAVAGEASSVEPERAEYAVRWDAATGGLKTAEAVRKTLKKAPTASEAPATCHQFIATIPGSRGWRVSLNGRRVTAAAVKLRGVAYPGFYAEAA